MDMGTVVDGQTLVQQGKQDSAQAEMNGLLAQVQIEKGVNKKLADWLRKILTNLAAVVGT